MVVLLFGVILVAGAIGTIAEHQGWWLVAAGVELVLGVAFLWPRRRQ